jgi:hypothetical protein
MGMNYPVLQGLGHDDVQDAYGPILGIPVSVIISRDGKICATHTGLTARTSSNRRLSPSCDARASESFTRYDDLLHESRRLTFAVFHVLRGSRAMMNP